MIAEWAFSRLNLTYTYKYLGRIFTSMLYIFNVMIVWWILCYVGTAKWKWFSEMSDRSTSFWFCLVLLLILLVGMRIFAWRVTKELPEEKRLIVKKELIKELQALANIGIIVSYIYIFGTDSQGILREGYLHAVEVWISAVIAIDDLTIHRDVWMKASSHPNEKHLTKAVSLYYETAFVIMRHSKKSEMEFRNERDKKKKLLCCIGHSPGGYSDTVLSGILFSGEYVRQAPHCITCRVGSSCGLGASLDDQDLSGLNRWLTQVIDTLLCIRTQAAAE